MKSPLLKSFSTAFIVLCAAQTQPGHTANITVHGTGVCEFVDAAGVTPVTAYDQRGIYNSRPSNSATVICGIPRSPLATSATGALFYVDGDNDLVDRLGNRYPTRCTLYSYDYTGLFLGSVADLSNLPTYDISLLLPAAQASRWAYLAVICDVAPGGHLRGVTSVQGDSDAASAIAGASVESLPRK